MKKEIWKDIDGYNGRYQISNLGNIRSLAVRVRCRNGTRLIKERFLKIQMGKRHYRIISLCKNYKYTTTPIHRLVAKAFIPNPLNKPCVNHKDCDKLNNCASNLEWVTHKENTSHAWRQNLMKPLRGSESGNSKLNENDIPKIRKLIEKGVSQIKISKKFGCSGKAISDIKIGRTWKHI